MLFIDDMGPTKNRRFISFHPPSIATRWQTLFTGWIRDFVCALYKVGWKGNYMFCSLFCLSIEEEFDF
jgi:hypothetical protein